MAYSNINRDKGQQPRAGRVKNTVIVAGLLIVMLSSIMNFYRQWNTLREARQRNQQLQTRLNQIDNENKQMLHQIEIASSSAYVERKAREYLGLGTTNDVWLILPKEDDSLNLNTEVTATEDKPNIMKWWELFRGQAKL